MKEKNKDKGLEEKMKEAGNKMTQLGKKLTIGLTVPIILFIIGFLFLPLGVLLWVVAILVFIGTFFGKKKNSLEEQKRSD